MPPAQATAALDQDPDVHRRLRWMQRVGLGHMAIGRGLDTLSGGERQRLLLARHLAAAADPADLRLVLDEPTAGLHGQDVERFLALCDELVDGGATVLVVEHDLRVIARADHVIDVGPGAGEDGGRIVYAGAPADLPSVTASVTGHYLPAPQSAEARR